MNTNGKEELDSQTIAKSYLFSKRFVVDALTVIGSDFFTLINKSLRIFAIFKVARIFRLSSVIKNSTLPEELKALLNLIKLTFYLYLLMHIMGCGWYMLTFSNKDLFDSDGRSLKWYPPSDWSNYIESDLFSDENSLAFKFFMSLYTAIMMLGSNEIGPVNKSEIAFCSVCLLISSLINAQIFGEMAVLISTMKKKQTAYFSKLDIANNAMNNLNLPIILQEDIHDYLSKTMTTRER
jgi:hypothetical protein